MKTKEKPQKKKKIVKDEITTNTNQKREEEGEKKKEDTTTPKRDNDISNDVVIDEKILNSVNERMKLLNKIIDDIENNISNNEEEEDSEDGIGKDDEVKNVINEKNETVNIPIRFKATYQGIEKLMKDYIEDFNNYYYKEIFENFSSTLKEIYDNKYKKYIDTSIEYHHHIKENQHILENEDDLTDGRKMEIQQIIDSLKEEQQNEIAKIEDEFNRLIVNKVNEFKINSFKNNSGIQLMEEKLKCDIYSMINQSFC